MNVLTTIAVETHGFVALISQWFQITTFLKIGQKKTFQLFKNLMENIDKCYRYCHRDHKAYQHGASKIKGSACF
jgi:hypothetical protein